MGTGPAGETAGEGRKMTIQRFETGARMSQAVVHGDTVYLAGQVADDAAADARAQTEQVLRKIDRLLETAGSDRSKILSATLWLADIRAYDEVNAVWDAWVPKGQAPARACVEAKLARPGLKVEIGVIAAR
jgi:enamine deaminase RidA (YjgF/YER057c/UK114 family)